MKALSDWLSKKFDVFDLRVRAGRGAKRGENRDIYYCAGWADGYKAAHKDARAASKKPDPVVFDYFQGDADRHWYYVEQGTTALEAKGPFMTKTCAIQHSKDGTFRVID